MGLSLSVVQFFINSIIIGKNNYGMSHYLQSTRQSKTLCSNYVWSLGSYTPGLSASLGGVGGLRSGAILSAAAASAEL